MAEGNGNGQVIKLITDMKESLERELQAFRVEVNVRFVEVNTRFDNQAARLDRQAGVMQTGNRWISRLNDWSEKLDAAMEVKDRQIAELRERVDAIEKLQARTPPPSQ